MLHLFSDHRSKITESSVKSSKKRSATAALLAAAVALTMIAGGCGSKDTETSSAASQAEESTVVSSQAAESSSKAETSDKDASSKEASSAASSKAASKAESKAESKSEGSKDASKAESKADAAQPEEKEAPAEQSSEAKNESGYKAGDTVVVSVNFGNIKMNGQPAKIGAYDFWLSYDPSAVEYVDSKEQTKSDINMVNEKEAGIVKIAHVAAMGFKEDYSGDRKPTYKITFKVLKDTNDLGMSAQVPSLAAVSMDGKSTLVLINNKNPQDMDKYADFTIEKQ